MASLVPSSPFKHDDLCHMFNLNVEDIDALDVEHTPKEVIINITLRRLEINCTVCGCDSNNVKGYVEKKILHALLTNYPCHIKYRARRLVCNDFRRLSMSIILLLMEV